MRRSEEQKGPLHAIVDRGEEGWEAAQAKIDAIDESVDTFFEDLIDEEAIEQYAIEKLYPAILPALAPAAMLFGFFSIWTQLNEWITSAGGTAYPGKDAGTGGVIRDDDGNCFDERMDQIDCPE